MAKDLGPGVSRTLDALNRMFQVVVFQKGKPPLDAEFSLQDDIHNENRRQLIAGMMPSGFLLNPARPLEDFQFSQSWANLFKFGSPKAVTGSHESARQFPVVWANVGGWILPICGSNTESDADLSNLIKLYPPPETDSRIDFVFLEAWMTRVDSNPSTVNKPAADHIWKYGNVLFGGTNLTDDLEDPTIGFETTARIQVQYRIRVYGQGVGLGGSVALDVYPDGLDDPNILGQGTTTAPVGGFQFTNMGKELGDPSLWRAGDGDPNNDLGTVDGYTWAIPICAVFRRNSNVYVAVQAAGNPNQNGGFNRTPGSKLLPDPLAGARALTTATLTAALSPTAGIGADVVVSVTNLNGSGLEDTEHVLSSVFLILDDEIVSVSNVNLVGGTITIPGDTTNYATGGRGRYATAAVGHVAGTTIRFFNTRPDGRFSDEITETDILDLRRAVNPGDWDFGRLLEHNIGALLKGDLRTAWKKAGVGDTQGPVAHEVDYLHADGSQANPNHTEALDGPDGIRTIWSDAAVIQQDVTLRLDNDAPQNNQMVGYNNDPLDATVQWDVGPDFKPAAWMNVHGLAATNVWANGSLIFLHIGGQDGTEGARGTFRDGSTRAVRFLMPQEYWKSGYPTVDANNGNQYPSSVRFLTQRAHEPPPTTLYPTLVSRHPGPM